MTMRGMTAAAICMVVLFGGCTGTWGLDCVQGTSAPVERELALAAFTGIVSDGPMEVTLTRGEMQHVVATGPAEVLDLIKTDVSGGVWHIDLKKCYNTSQPLRIAITIPSIDRVEVDGSGNVSSSSTFEPEQLELAIHGSGNISLQVNCKSAEAEIAGSGDITLGGTCASFEAEIAGSGDIHAMELSTAHTKASIAGSGGMEVTAVETLKADIAGSGDVRYKGRPEVTSNIAGSGSVTPME